MCRFLDVAGVLFVERLGLLRQAETPEAPVYHDLAGHALVFPRYNATRIGVTCEKKIQL